MRYYESLYIVNPNYEQNRINNIMKEIQDKCSNLKLKVINHSIWGKKRLAYSIEKHKYGSFILLHFETSAVNSLQEFDRFMILHNNVIRNQTVLLDQKPEPFTNELAEEESPKSDDIEDNKLSEEPEVINDGDLNEPPDKEQVKE